MSEGHETKSSSLSGEAFASAGLDDAREVTGSTSGASADDKNLKEKVDAAEQKMQRIRVYTRTGDKGTSSLYSGERRSKDDEVFNTLGDVDELNSALGVAYEFCRQAELADTCKQIEEIQSRLLDVGSAVATPLVTSSSRKVERARFDPTAVDALERWIDGMDDHLAPLRAFILPSGGLAGSHLHVARTLCRRAERSVVPLVAAGQVEDVVMRFLNRLSDYLFTAARYAALKTNQPETIYKKALPPT